MAREPDATVAAHDPHARVPARSDPAVLATFTEIAVENESDFWTEENALYHGANWPVGLSAQFR